MTFHVEPLIAVTITNPGVYIIVVALLFCALVFAGLGIHEHHENRRRR